MAEHTPTPWACEEIASDTMTRIYSPDGIMLAHAHSYPKYSSKHPDADGRRANAAFIVKAVNSHNALVRALKSAHTAFGTIAEMSCELRSGGPDLSDLQALSDSLTEAVELAHDQASATLAALALCEQERGA